jgi:predicted nucleic acid-binding protein
LAAVGEEVYPQPQPPIIEDPKDQSVIETATTGEVSVICTLDSHFKKAPVLAFLATHAIQVLNDSELLQMLRKATH